jgi:hypothetical protein
MHPYRITIWAALLFIGLVAHALASASFAQPMNPQWAINAVKDDTIYLFQIDDIRQSVGLTDQQKSEISQVIDNYSKTRATLFEGLADLKGPELEQQAKLANARSDDLRKRTITEIVSELSGDQAERVKTITNDLVSGRSGIIKVVGKSKVVPIYFNADELDKVNPDAFNLKIAEKAGSLANCPEERTYLGNGTWLCGDGTIVTTSNARLQTLFSATLRETDDIK